MRSIWLRRHAVVQCLSFAVFPGTGSSLMDQSASGPRPVQAFSILVKATAKTGGRGASVKLDDRARKWVGKRPCLRTPSIECSSKHGSAATAAGDRRTEQKRAPNHDMRYGPLDSISDMYRVCRTILVAVNLKRQTNCRYFIVYCLVH